MDYRMFGYESFDRAALPGLFGLKPLRPGTPQPKSFVFLYGGFSGQTAFSGNNFDFVQTIDKVQNDKENIHKTPNQNNIKLLVLNYKLWSNTNLIYSFQDL